MKNSATNFYQTSVFFVVLFVSLSLPPLSLSLTACDCSSCGFYLLDGSLVVLVALPPTIFVSAPRFVLSHSLRCSYVRAAAATSAVAVGVVLLLLLRAFSFSQLSSRRKVLVCSGTIILNWFVR